MNELYTKKCKVKNQKACVCLMFYPIGFEEDILIVSEGKMAPFTHDFRKAQQRMPAIPVNIHHVNFTWQATDQVRCNFVLQVAILCQVLYRLLLYRVYLVFVCKK